MSCSNVHVVSAVAIMERTTGRCCYASWRAISSQRQVCDRRGRFGQWLARHNHCATVITVIKRSMRLFCERSRVRAGKMRSTRYLVIPVYCCEFVTFFELELDYCVDKIYCALASRPTVDRLVIHCLADRQPYHYAPSSNKPQTLFLSLNLTQTLMPLLVSSVVASDLITSPQVERTTR